jgi:hypothetical protein
MYGVGFRFFAGGAAQGDEARFRQPAQHRGPGAGIETGDRVRQARNHRLFAESGEAIGTRGAVE